MPEPNCYWLERRYWHAHTRERTRGRGTKHYRRRLFHSPGRAVVGYRLRERPYGQVPGGRNTGPDTAGGPAGPEPGPARQPELVARPVRLASKLRSPRPFRSGRERSGSEKWERLTCTEN